MISLLIGLEGVVDACVVRQTIKKARSQYNNGLLNGVHSEEI